MLKKENLSLEEQTNLKDLQLKYKNIYISRAEGAFIHYWKKWLEKEEECIFLKLEIKKKKYFKIKRQE